MKLTFSRTRAAAVAVLVGLLGVTACGGGSSDAGAGAAAGRDKITIATSNDAPFSFTDPSGKLQGIDGEMINAIAAQKGWDVEVFTTDFNTLIPALKAKKADAIVDAMYITDARKKEISFTDEWYTQGEGMLVPAGSTVTARDQLQGKVIGAQTGTVFVDFIKTLGGSDTKFFDSQAALITGVANGQVDAAFTDSAVLAYSLVQKPNPKIKLVDPYKPYFPGSIGAGVRQDDPELLTELNAGLADLKKTPQYLEILKKYGLTESNASK